MHSIGKYGPKPGADSRISVKGVHMYKGVGVLFADFFLIFLNIP